MEGAEELLLSTALRQHIVCVLKMVGGNQCHAAKLLGISRWTLTRKMKKYGIRIVEERKQNGQEPRV